MRLCGTITKRRFARLDGVFRWLGEASREPARTASEIFRDDPGVLGAISPKGECSREPQWGRRKARPDEAKSEDAGVECQG